MKIQLTMRQTLFGAKIVNNFSEKIIIFKRWRGENLELLDLVFVVVRKENEIDLFPKSSYFYFSLIHSWLVSKIRLKLNIRSEHYLFTHDCLNCLLNDFIFKYRKACEFVLVRNCFLFQEMELTNVLDKKLKRTERFGNCSLREFQEANRNPIWGYEESKISTLEEAVETILPIVPHLSDYVSSAKQNCNKKLSQLTQHESAAIYLYTMSTNFYGQLNAALRQEDRNQLKPWFGFLKLIMNALNKLPSIKAVIWRGISDNVTTHVRKHQLQTWWSMNSCTKDLKVVGAYLATGGTLFSIEAINGKDISTYSAFKDEKEIILIPGTRLCVKSEPLDHNANLFIVQLEEQNCELPSPTCRFDYFKTNIKFNRLMN